MTDHDHISRADHGSHDLDLIAAHAGGDAGADTGAAQLLIESCPDCLDEFRLHREVAVWLGSAPMPTLTEGERRSLHTWVSQRAQPAPVVSLGARFSRRWLAIGSVAAAALVTVGTVGALSGLDNGGESAELAVEEAAVDPLDSSARAEGDDGAAAFSGPAADAATETSAAASDETTAAMSEDAAGGGPAPPIYTLGDVSRTELVESTTRAVEQVVSTVNPTPVDPALLSDDEIPAPQCLTAGRPDAYGLVTARVDGQDIEVFVVFDPELYAYRADAFAVTPDGCTPYDLEDE